MDAKTHALPIEATIAYQLLSDPARHYNRETYERDRGEWNDIVDLVTKARVMPHLKEASLYLRERWLEGYRKRTLEPLSRVEQTMLDPFLTVYFLTRDCEIVELYDDYRLDIIVPRNVGVCGKLGDSTLYLMRDYTVVNGVLPESEEVPE